MKEKKKTKIKLCPVFIGLVGMGEMVRVAKEIEGNTMKTSSSFICCFTSLTLILSGYF